MQVFVVGRFPPPVDGQTLGTRRLAELLDVSHEVGRVNTEPPAADFVLSETTFRPERVRHYVGIRKEIARALQAAPSAPVLWASISPMLLGHARDLVATLPALGRSHPVYAVLHRGTFDRLFGSPLTGPTARRLARRMTGFVFLNAMHAAQCAPWIPEAQRFIIPNTVDEAVLCSEAEVEARRASRRSRDALRLLYLSNMIGIKGYLDVLHGVQILHARGVPVEAHFAGRWESDEDRRGFEAFVAEHGLQATVIHHGGVQDRAAIKQLHQKADVFLLPSYHPTEAQPLSILEALNAGSPVVTTNHGGIPLMVRHGQEALFVPPRSPEALAGAVERLRDYTLWRTLSEGARARFLQTYSPDAVRGAWEALLARHAS